MTSVKWNCANCDREPGDHERAHEWQDKIVCGDCYRRLSVNAKPSPNIPFYEGHRAGSTRRPAKLPKWFTVPLLLGIFFCIAAAIIWRLFPQNSAVPGMFVGIAGAMFTIVAAGVCLLLSFLPYIIAKNRNHPNSTAILVLCLFAWTGVIWLVALVWAVMVAEVAPKGERL